jgi:sugar porter (SP) family MFS transporter
MPLGGAVGSLFASILSTRIGRRNLILLNNIPFILGYLIISTSATRLQFGAGRFLTGIGSGLSSVAVSSYIGETSTVKLRGVMGTLMQVSIDVGIMISQILGFFLSYDPGWRILFGIPCILSVIQTFLLPLCPKSPPHLVSLGKLEEAKANLQRLRPGRNIDNEFQHIIEAQINIQRENTSRSDLNNPEQGERKFNFFREIVKRPYPKFLLICIFIHMNQMLSGINSVAYYSTTIFTESFGKFNASRIAVSLGAMEVIGVLLTVFTVDSYGRKHTYFVSCLVMFFTLILICVGAQRGIHFLMLGATFLFMGGFALGVGPIPFLLVSELFPSNLLTFTSSFVITINWLCNALVGFLFPIIYGKLGNYTFLLFAVFCFITMVVWAFLFKETKGKTLDVIIKEGMKKD